MVVVVDDVVVVVVVCGGGGLWWWWFVVVGWGVPIGECIMSFSVRLHARQRALDRLV